MEDISSGSTTQNFARWITDDRYGALRNIVRNQYTGQGDRFEPNNVDVVDHIYINSAKLDAPEVINSSDMIEILNQDDLEFTRESRPIDYFYAVEKSMYQTISDEMLKVFATIADFNNLIGEPVNRYRGYYKDMDKLKSLFFESIGNSPDLDKYVDFYKWIDAAITKFLEQIFPASANYSDELRTVVESHVLERSAYRNKFPTLESKQEPPEAPVLGINELTYNWKFGHAPKEIQALAAVGTVQIVGTPPDEGSVVSITSTAGTTKTYVFMEDGVDSTGTIDGGSVVVQLDGVSGVGNIAAELQTAINHANGHNGGSANSVISISRADGILTLTQVVKGENGNQTITYTGGTASHVLVQGFTGGQDAKENKNCLWYNQRAERTVPALSSSIASVNTDRQTLLDIATTDNSGSYLERYQGSTYVLRKLSKPYKEGVSFVKNLHGGTNFSPNKKKNFWKDLLKKNSNNGLFITGSSVIIDDPKEDRNCTDADDSQIKYKAKSIVRLDDDNDGNTFTAPPYNEYKGDSLLPFNIYSTASLDPNGIGTYPLNSFESLSPSQAKVVITNLHDDSYGTLNEIPMQGPFAEKYEGGNQHRHYRLNDGTDTITNRPEAFRLNPVGVGGMSVIAPGNAIIAGYQRDFVAKRPVVIKNILQTTASVDARLGGTITHGPIGNYSAQHNIVQTSGRKINNKYFVEAEGVGFGKVFSGLEASPKNPFYNRPYNFGLPQRTTFDSVIVERFSAPGGFETISRGYLDPFAEEMSAYNAMPFRNLTVRGERFKKRGVTSTGVTFLQTNPALYSSGLLTIVSDGGKSVVYIFKTTGTTGDLDSGRVIVKLTGTSQTAFVNQLIIAINSANGHNAGVPDSELGAINLGATCGILGASSISCTLTASRIFISDSTTAQVEMSASTWSTASLGLRSLLSRHTIFGGYDYEAQSDGAFHKTYRNRLRKIEMNDGESYLQPGGAVHYQQFKTSHAFDNAFITHMIPRSDFQYSWVTASVLSTDPSNVFGFGYFPYSGEVSSSASGFESAVNFVSSSDLGVFPQTVPQNRLYGFTKAQATALADFTSVDFAGTNGIFVPQSAPFTGNLVSYDLTNPFSDLVVGPLTTNNIGVVGSLNGILLNNNGPYGYPTGRQVRNMYHRITRYLKDTNTYSISVRNSLGAAGNQVVLPMMTVKTKPHSYNELLGFPHLLSGFKAKTIENYIEPPLTSKFMPMKHRVNVINAENELAPLTIDHTYANNFDYFANPQLMNKLNYAGVIEQPGRQVYDNLLDYIAKGSDGTNPIPAEANPIKGFRNLVYKETIYPKEQHTYLAKSRGRTSYSEELSSINLDLGQQRTFWKDFINQRQRTSEVARNSLGYRLDEINQVQNNGLPYVDFALDLSVFPLDVGERVTSATSSYSQLTGTNHGQLSIAAFQQSMVRYLNDDKAGDVVPTASFSYEYHNFISSSAAEGFEGGVLSEYIPDWDTARLSGKKPWFDSYEDYASDIRLMGQEYTVLPEFRISQHMDYYLDKGSFFGFNSKNNKYLTLEGGHLSQSAESESDSFDQDFFNIYTHSDFVKHFEVINEQHDGVAKQTKMTIKCSAIKKLLPYNGFYPANRTVQLGNLMSQSFAQFITGSDIHYSDPNAERISSLMQPFFSPGILYNTIKSGIAVDWLTFTGSVPAIDAAQNFQQAISEDSGSFRFPFESLIEPQNFLPARSKKGSDTNARLFYLDTRHFSSSMRVTGAYSVWTGQNKENYSLAMNNFLGEIPNFFLDEGKFSSIESTTQASFMSGVNYYMDLDIYKTNDMIMYEGPNTVARVGGSLVASRTRQARGMHYGPALTWRSPLSNTRIDRFDPAYAAWTPPYFYGKSTVRFEFKPHEFTDLLEGESIDVGEADSAFSLNEIVSFLAISGTTFFNNFEYDESGALEDGLTDSTNLSPVGNTVNGSLATKHQMQANASMNLFNVVQKPVFTFDPISGKKLTATETTKGRWIISPKFECPILNFSGNVGNVFAGTENQTKGMWRGYGSIPDTNEGIFYNIRESFPTQAPVLAKGNPVLGITNSNAADTTIGSLREKLFPTVQPQRLGSIAGEKEIFEAVVAIPFTVNNSGGKKSFFPLIPAEDKIVEKIKGRKVVEALLGNDEPLPTDVYKPGQTIIDQIDRMQKYVFPPSLDFINNKNLSPMQMYIFEFNHTLDQQDLTDIWQGVMPKISLKAEKQSSSITHFLTNNELMLGKDITKEIRWMVFKVKQRATHFYQETLDKSVGTDRFKEDESSTAYNYNWPYDFFSLVELAKIDTGLQIGGEVPVTPPDITTAPVPDQKRIAKEGWTTSSKSWVESIWKRITERCKIGDEEDPN